jgi:hypothetical protein
MIWLVYLLRKKIKFNFDFRSFLFSTLHCRVAIQFEYCFSNIGLYIDIYGYCMLSMGFVCCLEEILFQSFEGTESDWN